MYLDFKCNSNLLYFTLHRKNDAAVQSVINSLAYQPASFGLSSWCPASGNYISIDIYLVWQNDKLHILISRENYFYYCSTIIDNCVDTLASATTLDRVKLAIRNSVTVSETGTEKYDFKLVFLDYYTDTMLITSDERDNYMKSRMMGLPYYRDWIGAYPWQAPDDWTNHNVSMEYKQIESGTQANTNIRWSNIQGTTFPVLNYCQFNEDILAVIPQPSYLPMQYLNTVIVFTRNSINRIVLTNDLSQMAEIPNNIIKEYSNLGLYAPKSLVNTPNGLIWLSEKGVILWNASGLKNISQNRIIVSGDKNIIRACYYPLLNQYVLYTGDTDKNAWVYHLDYDCWTRFTDFEIIDAVSLDYGEDILNSLLLVKNDGIWEYNTGCPKVTDAYFLSKRYRLDYIKPVRFRLLSTQYPSLLKILTRNVETGGYMEKELKCSNYRWVLIPNGFWGEYIQFYCKNIDQLTRLEIDIKEVL